MQNLLNETVTKEKAHIIKELQEELFQKEGNGWFRIISGSMHPLIDINDKVLVKRIFPSEVRLGDIILFKSDDALVMHRVIKIEEQNGRMMILQKGDASLNAGVTDSESIIGKVVAIEKKGKILSLDSGRGKVINNFLGFINSVFYRFNLKISGIKQWLRDKPGFDYIKAFYNILRKPFTYLYRLMIKASLT